MLNSNQFRNDSDSDCANVIDPVQVDSRCRVIKVLQEQITNQNKDTSDISKLRSQLLIAEQTLEMKEAEYKLRIDDLEYEVEQLKLQNSRLKDSFFQQKEKATIAVNNADENEINKKYKKWKTKYHSLANSEDYQASAKVFQIQSELKAKQEENQKNVEEISRLTEVNINLSNKVMLLTEDLKRTRGLLENATTKSNNFQEQIKTLNLDKKKLTEDAKQKSTLLQHNRKMHAREEKNLKEKEKSQLAQMKAQKHANYELQNEITRLKTIIDKEAKEKKSIMKKFNKMKQDHEEMIAKLKEQLETLKNDNDALLQDLEASRSSGNSLGEEVSTLKNENSEMQIRLQRAAKIKEHNALLKGAINEMKTTIDNLQNSVSSFESDSIAKTEQMRNLLSKNYAGIDPFMEWNDIVEYFSNMITQVKDLSAENSDLIKKNKKLTKSNKTIKSETQETKEQATKKNEVLEKQLKECQDKISQLMNENSNDSALFCQSIRKKIDCGYLSYYKTVQQIIAKLTKTEYCPVSMRSLVLMSILTTRIRHFKKSAPYDGSTILEFASSNQRDAKSPVLILKEKVDELVNQEMKEAEELEKLKRSNADLQTKSKKFYALCKELQQKIDEQLKIIEEMKLKNSELQSIIDRNATAEDFAKLDAKYNKKIQEYNEIERQFLEMKVEMKRLLTTVDSQQREDLNFQATIEELTLEVEQLKQTNDKIKHELEIAQVSLREKNREILSLERRLVKQKSQVVVVKDQIPTGYIPPQIPLESNTETTTKSNFYMNDNLRNSLAQMQNRLMRRSEMI
ncbi:hypothetical protein TRFO_26420 [Tritrichomonas foetus]|uniref:Uncharacterized protein n=1 Tax=Tritrichomonas foetus TaxID=1144522 RepID=A0A1J4K2Y6_9EUKA|nr:hypothetical protein TRFO_26420 [Tritrichomonas foetus]|eukprot:OHT05751.1 hypothetical protein TRFO_26420 [Tritrichomonas foetus]